MENVKINFSQSESIIKTKKNIYFKTIYDLFKISFGNNVKFCHIDLNANGKLNKILKINKTNIKNNNIGKLIYQIDINNNETKIFGKNFININNNKVQIIIKNKQYKLVEKIKNKENPFIIIKIKFLENIVNIGSMLKECKEIFSIRNISKLNIVNIDSLFFKCSSLIYIVDISNWNIKKITNTS